MYFKADFYMLLKYNITQLSFDGVYIVQPYFCGKNFDFRFFILLLILLLIERYCFYIKRLWFKRKCCFSK